MSCDFVAELSKLRKLSQESVDNTESFDDFKRYMHVVRPVEEELRTLLENVRRAGKKCLVLLCGSAGDGKSHLLSYLKNADPEHLLDGFELCNDATESSAPTLTFVDTLAEKLSDFNDDNCGKDNGHKMILAINLGTLNNFIESEKGKAFSALKKYVVEDNEIFSASRKQSRYKPDSVFQHVSFSDFQVFSLREDGVGTDYLEKLIAKVFDQDDKNPFYKAYTYKDNADCPSRQRCPVCHNFEFLMEDPKHQKAVIKRIVEVVIKDKAIVSTREVLNFLYDIMVHPAFDYSKTWESGPNETNYLTYYIQGTTPMLMYEYGDISPLINAVRKHDFLRSRRAEMDAEATRFHSMDNVEEDNVYEELERATRDTPYAKMIRITDKAKLRGIRSELKKDIFRFIVRTKHLKGEYPPTDEDQLFSKFIQCLYYQNSGKEKARELKELYRATENAVMCWDGKFEKGYICIDDTNDKFWVLEQLLIKRGKVKLETTETDDILRFSTSLKLCFEKEDDKEDDKEKGEEISMDYSLFEMVYAMRDGYRPTVQGRNLHTEFASFVQRLIKFGNKADRITLISKDNEHKYKAVFEDAGGCDYDFEVV